jgi:hypothetical protein
VTTRDSSLRRVFAKIQQARRLFLRVELTLGALQMALWLSLAIVSVGALLLVRRRITAAAPSAGRDPSTADHVAPRPK